MASRTLTLHDLFNARAIDVGVHTLPCQTLYMKFGQQQRDRCKCKLHTQTGYTNVIGLAKVECGGDGDLMHINVFATKGNLDALFAEMRSAIQEAIVWFQSLRSRAIHPVDFGIDIPAFSDEEIRAFAQTYIDARVKNA